VWQSQWLKIATKDVIIQQMNAFNKMFKINEGLVTAAGEQVQE
jgi:hypothetical protein